MFSISSFKHLINVDSLKEIIIEYVHNNDSATVKPGAYYVDYYNADNKIVHSTSNSWDKENPIFDEKDPNIVTDYEYNSDGNVEVISRSTKEDLLLNRL